MVLKQLLHSPVCINCGSFFIGRSLYCEICFNKKVINYIRNVNKSHLGTEHNYLFNWQSSDADLLDQLVYRLKGGKSKEAWSYYAELFFKTAFFEKDFHCIVPVPSQREFPDHARLFGDALSKLSGIPLMDLLRRNQSKQQQKFLKLAERKQNLDIKLEHTPPEQITKCLIVDDILTSGESYLQCKAALKQFEEIRAISLFYRPKM